ncbi:hypothetical protein NQ318_003966 [Aromia moschata]|uniref:Solute carrier family 46 member 3 n=1 Tax=Aromia moschata TaxID=1265417 RepID=A0AAV8Z9D4_9CUCU|nr:hypothetical protein NQ318_003966 [Aromia moschata]
MASTADLVTDSVPDLTKKDEKTFWRMNFGEKASYIREVVTVEPLVTAYIIVVFLCQPALLNLELEKACRVNLNYNDTVCEAILSGNHENFSAQNDETQVVVNNVRSWNKPIETIVPLILVLFLGSYSDRHKWRKPLLLLPIIGEFFSIVGIILCVVFMDSWPLEVLAVVRTVIPSFTGGQSMMVMAVFAYIADVSTLEMRTLRMGVVQITINIFSPIVLLISGQLFIQIGYYGVLLVGAAFYVFALVYGIFAIKEPKQPVKDRKKGLLADVFDPKHAIDTFNLMLKKNPDNNRIYIFLVLVTIFVYSGVNDGEGNCFFLYLQRQLHWTVVEFAYMVTISTVVHLVGIVISLVTGVTAVTIRSMATKIVSQNDLGKAQSLFSICEAIAPVVFTPLYGTVIYNNTLNVFPGTFLFVGIVLYLICCVIVA